ncbi:MAG: arsinothricin resistance N-acetyltransferase ArsN1 family B [Pseudomonadota bacterium]
MIRPALASDAEAIAHIYNDYILNTAITFEEQEVSLQQMAQRMEDVAALSLPWLVVEQAGQVVGYAYASKWKVRSAYRYSVESTIYLARDVKGKGLGSQLYMALFELLKEKGVHVVVSGITLPNPASIALHEKLGLKKIAHFEEIGFKFNEWLDVGYWQVIF